MEDAAELIAYITGKILQYLNLPKEEKRQIRSERRARRQPLSEHWFGLLALSFRLWKENRSKRRKLPPNDQMT